jgi:hypothetical protein
MHVAHEVGHVWGHQQRHSKLMIGQSREPVHVRLHKR